MSAASWRASAGAVGLALAWATLALSPGASAAVASADAQGWSGPARCRFSVPEGFAARDLRWTGGCRGGLAQGRGVLRALQGGRVLRLFYGRLEAGLPAQGVVEEDGSYRAGRFEAGRLVADGERNTLIAAFDEASAAARQVADGYRKAGNAASARFYQDKARQLARQID